jgi:hypothetical protein
MFCFFQLAYPYDPESSFLRIVLWRPGVYKLGRLSGCDDDTRRYSSKLPVLQGIRLLF